MSIMKRLLLILVGCVLLLPCTVHGCSLAPLQEHRVSPDLMVLVTHREKPIAGIEVTVTAIRQNSEAGGSVEPVFKALTDDRGEVSIHDLSYGRYFLEATHSGLKAGTVIIEVVANPRKKREKKLVFQWADWSYQTRSVAGTLSGLIPGDTGKPLMDLLHPKETIYPGVALVLKNAFSDEEYRTVSDSTGCFLLPNIPDGTYTLTISGGMKSISGTGEETVLVIDVDQRAPRDSLRLRLKDNGCYRTEFQLEERES
jgi:hypothetical protein